MVRKKEQSLMAHILSILLLPFNVTIIIPLILLYYFDFNLAWGLKPPYNIFLYIISLLCIVLGLTIVISTITQFAKEGKGTLAPWNPPQRLVVSGLYQYTRNPMISGVVIILFGEVWITGSLALLIWFVLFTVGNYIYFLFVEEPKLEEKFGRDYMEYKENVPRLLPRRRPWSPENK